MLDVAQIRKERLYQFKLSLQCLCVQQVKAIHGFWRLLQLVMRLGIPVSDLAAVAFANR
jgi:hypothetical protein